MSWHHQHLNENHITTYQTPALPDSSGTHNFQWLKESQYCPQNPVKDIYIIIECVDGTVSEQEDHMIMEVDDIFTTQKEENTDLVNSILRNAHRRKLEFWKLLEEYDELVKEIQQAENDLRQNSFMLTDMF